MADDTIAAPPAMGVLFIPPAEGNARNRYREGEIVREERWYGIVYTGTAASLVRAGLAEHRMLPGQPTQNKVSVTIFASDGTKAGAIRKLSSRIFEVKKLFSDEEIERRKNSEAAREKAAEALELERRRIAFFPNSHDQFIEKAVRCLRAGLNCARVGVFDGKGGYTFAPETVSYFDRVAEELEEILRHGETRFSRKSRDMQITQIKAETSKADAPLQNFLQALSKDLPPAKERQQ